MADRHIKRFSEHEIILPHSNGGGLGGYFHIEAFRAIELMNGTHIEIAGTRRHCATFENNVTNNGLDLIGGDPGQWSGHASVGTGNAAESNADTTLDTFVASRTADGAYNGWGYSWYAQPTPPYWGEYTRKYRFLPNFAPGAINVSEVGISNQPATGNLFCRALVKDGGGTPTTFAVAADEYLDIFYTLRIYADHIDYTTGATDDGTGSFDVAGTTYNYTIRAANITNAWFWGRNLGNGLDTISEGYNGFGRAYYYGTDAALGPVTGGMTATLSMGHFYTWGVTASTYVPTTYTRTLTWNCGLDDANLAGGIKGLMPWSSFGCYQMLLDAAIPKDNTKEFHWTQRWTWTRHVIT